MPLLKALDKQGEKGRGLRIAERKKKWSIRYQASAARAFQQDVGVPTFASVDSSTLLERLQTNESRSVVICPEETSVMTARFGRTAQHGHWLAAGTERGRLVFVDTEVPDQLKMHSTMYEVENAHTQSVFDLCWTVDDTEVVTASAERAVCIFDTHRLCAKHRLEGHDMTVRSVDTHPLGESLVLSGGRDGNALVWDTRAHCSKQQVVITISSPPPSERLERTGRRTPPSTLSRRVLVDVRSHMRKVIGPYLPQSEGEGSAKRKKQSSSRTSSTPVGNSGIGSITSVRFIDDRLFATASSRNGVIKFWDARMARKKLTEVNTVAIEDDRKRSIGISSLSLSSDRSSLVVSTNANSVVVLPKLAVRNGKVITSACSSPPLSHAHSKPSISSPSHLPFTTPDEGRRGLYPCLSPFTSLRGGAGRAGGTGYDGMQGGRGESERWRQRMREVASSGRGGGRSEWDPIVLKGVESGQHLYVSSNISNDGRYVCSGSMDQAARVWDLTRPADDPLVLPTSMAEVLGAAWCPLDQSKLVAYGDGGAIHVWTPSLPTTAADEQQQEEYGYPSLFSPTLWRSAAFSRTDPLPSSSSPPSAADVQPGTPRYGEGGSRSAERRGEGSAAYSSTPPTSSRRVRMDASMASMAPLTPPSIAAPFPHSDSPLSPSPGGGCEEGEQMEVEVDGRREVERGIGRHEMVGSALSPFIDASASAVDVPPSLRRRSTPSRVDSHYTPHTSARQRGGKLGMMFSASITSSTPAPSRTSTAPALPSASMGVARGGGEQQMGGEGASMSGEGLCRRRASPVEEEGDGMSARPSRRRRVAFSTSGRAESSSDGSPRSSLFPPPPPHQPLTTATTSSATSRQDEREEREEVGDDGSSTPDRVRGEVGVSTPTRRGGGESNGKKTDSKITRYFTPPRPPK